MYALTGPLSRRTFREHRAGLVDVTSASGTPFASDLVNMAETLRAERASEQAGAEQDPRWYAIYTRARHEKQVDRLLSERGFETFLPLAPRMSRWKDRRKLIEWPLFPSYVFGRFSLDDAYRVLGTPGVATLVKVNGRPAPIAAGELENVRLFACALRDGGVKADPTPRPFLETGKWVEIVDGPLAGVQGIVVEHRSRRRILIGLKTIGQGLEVDVDVGALRPIPEP